MKIIIVIIITKIIIIIITTTKATITTPVFNNYKIKKIEKVEWVSESCGDPP